MHFPNCIHIVFRHSQRDFVEIVSIHLINIQERNKLLHINEVNLHFGTS
jgi:hypothetical protein